VSVISGQGLNCLTPCGRSSNSTETFSLLEALMDKRSYERLADAPIILTDLLDVLCRNGWVEILVEALQKLVTASVSDFLLQCFWK
jgi:hypothetical protein